MGDKTSARYLISSGKYFWISRFTEWQHDDIITSRLSSASIFSYSVLTIVAPIAVSSTSAKPSFLSASRMPFIPDPSNSAIKDGAILTYTGSPD